MDNYVINIGRQYGSGGKEIAFKLAERLGIKAYDTEIITETARRSGISTNFFRKNDEKISRFSLFSAFTQDPIQFETRNCLNCNELFRIQSETIRSIAEAGAAIFVGRCADYVLRDHPRAINIFISAPIEERRKRIATRNNVTLEKADDMISKIDKRREEYYNYYTFGRWGFSETYHLCIDSSVLGIDKSIEFLEEFIKTRLKSDSDR